jgi:glutamate carboxypeptidase
LKIFSAKANFCAFVRVFLSLQMLEYFVKRQEQTLEFIRRLIEIESPSLDVEGSRTIADLLESNFKQLKSVASTERVEAANIGEHLIIRAFADLPEKQILLLGHTDTVHPRGSLGARPFRKDGDKVFAPGIFDMKTGVALMFEVLRAFDELKLKPSRPVTILLSCDEEIGSPSGRELVEREAIKSAFCLVCEPSAHGGKAKTERKGTGDFTITARGIPAHAGLEPESGASAVLELARQILVVQELNQPKIGTTANVCTIRGGTANNVIPAEAVCTLDIRFTKLSEAERIAAAIKNLKPFDKRVKLEINGGINRPPLERTPKVVELFERARKIAAAFDYDLQETAVGGASDGNFTAALGIPTLDGLGAKGGGAHTCEEYILSSDIPYRAALIAGLLL